MGLKLSNFPTAEESLAKTDLKIRLILAVMKYINFGLACAGFIGISIIFVSNHNREFIYIPTVLGVSFLFFDYIDNHLRKGAKTDKYFQGFADGANMIINSVNEVFKNFPEK